MTDELDISWLDEEETKILEISSDIPPQVEIEYVYINNDDEIFHVFKETHEIQNGVLKKEHLLKLIQQNKIQKGKKFRLSEIIDYSVNIKEDDFKKTAKEAESRPIGGLFTPLFKKHFLKNINYIDDIAFKPTITIFHSTNRLYLIYVENDSILPKAKPPIKINVQKKTKKVRFDEEDLENHGWKIKTPLNHTKKAHKMDTDL